MSKLQSEGVASRALRTHMFTRGWFTIKIPGGKFLSGFPDIFAYHPEFKLRLIETKMPHRKLRESQKRFAQRAEKYGCDVWVLESERDYWKLFKPPNWRMYL